MHANAEISARHSSGGDDRIGHAANHRARHREADAVVSAAAAGDGRIDANDGAIKVGKRSARVARIDGGVSLNVAFEGCQADIAAPLGAHDSCGDGALKSEGRADCDDPLTGLELVAVGETSWNQAAFFSSKHGDVGSRIKSNHSCLGGSAVVKNEFDFIGVGDNMVRRDDVAVARNHHAGSGSMLRAPTIVEFRRAGVDGHHAWRKRFGGVTERMRKFVGEAACSGFTSGLRGVHRARHPVGRRRERQCQCHCRRSSEHGACADDGEKVSLLERVGCCDRASEMLHGDRSFRLRIQGNTRVKATVAA